MTFRHFASLATAALLVPTLGRAVPLPHLKLTNSLPAADATVAEAPRDLRLWFSEMPELPMTRITLRAAQGTPVALGRPMRAEADGEVVVPIKGKMGAGRYAVTWRAASKDGHPVSGTLSFTVGK